MTDLTQERLKELLHYDPETGVFTWRHTLNRMVRQGEVAGDLMPKGYRRIGVDGNRYLAHRLAWLYVHGRWPSRLIDHINLNKADNRIANLREATYSQNGANSKSKGVVGLKGVTPHRNRFAAQITINRKRVYLGLFKTPEEAHAAYMRAANDNYGEFARAA